MMPFKSLSTLRRTAIAGGSAMALLVLSACHTVPPQNPALQEAHSAFDTASANPQVARGAQLELEKARTALRRADEAWAERRNEDETTHLAYLAARQVQVANNVGLQRAADDAVAAAALRRGQVQVQAKTREAQAAQADAQAAQADAQTANARADQLEQELQSLAAKRTPQGMVVVLQDVLFDVGKSTLRSGSRARLDRLATVLKKHPERQILIEGFTDNTGGDDLNQTLSEQRAQSVAQALTAMGVNAGNIRTRGYGTARPVATNDTAAGRQQNRRVEVVFSDAKGHFAQP